jgi:ATP-dependent DNA helicase DinG
MPATTTQRPTDLLAHVVEHKEGGSRRAGQDDMCAAVGDAFTDRAHLLVEAPTGTGKSLAYIVPAVAHTAELAAAFDAEDPESRPPRVVISTATKALQEQLMDVDLPFVAEALADDGVEFRYAMLKGRSNYVCRARLDQLGEPTAPSLFGVDTDQLDEITSWVEITRTGDRAELGHIDDLAWSKVSVGSDECPGAGNCRFGEQCFAEEAKRAARDADLVVVNTHLYAAHVASGNNVLPPHDAVVFDEAHELEDIFVSAFAVTFSPARLRTLAGLVGRGGGGTTAVERLQRLADRLETAARARLDSTVDLEGDQEVADLLDAIGVAASQTASELAGVDTRRGGQKLTETNAQATSAVDKLADDVETARGRAGDSGAAAWVEGTVEHPRLCAAQIDIAPILAARLFPYTTVVATSATLAIGGGFDVVAGRIGLAADSGRRSVRHRELIVDTPFSYRDQGTLYVAKHLPDPTREREAFEPAARDELTRLAVAAGGRTLALFTSWKAARAAAEHLRAHTDLNVGLQGEASRSDLVEQFATTPRSVLVATTSFWTGLDLHGDQCTLVVIDRIPFGRPNDPIQVARERICAERGGNGFVDVSLPAAAILLAQGVGRLIRSTSDRGVVAVLDQRLATKRYRNVLLDTIPPLRRSIDGAAVAGLLAELDADATARGH